MIVEYYRPKDVPETLKLLENQDTFTILMGGGTAIDRFKTGPMAVIDLQDVGLGKIRKKGNFLEIGATATLQSLYEDTQTSDELNRIILREATHNLRQVATVAGTLIASNGRSPFTSALLALDASVTFLPGDNVVPLGDLLLMRKKILASKLITKITIPLNVQLAYEEVARSPADLPLICAAVAVWSGGRTRVILGGCGEAPALVSDGPEKGGEQAAARDAYSHAGDEWASAEYRREVAPMLITRCFSRLEVQDE
jgi:CO/xanthine dehydrogenase FAD-binding subunit